MTPTYNKVHNYFKLNKIHYGYDELKEVAYSLIKEGEPYEKEIGNFLTDWLNGKSFIEVKTSGSTGQPKTIRLSKQAMVYSAIATGNFFNLIPGNTALHCLPTNYIAGKMMLVRGMILGLELDYVQPISTPHFNDKKHYDFCAMIPMQLSNVLDKTENISKIIIGGAKVNQTLASKIETCNGQFFETYGMTETSTHIAIRKLTSKVQEGSAFFNAISNITFSTDKRQCLVIDAPNLIDEPLITNDIVDLNSEYTFKLLGRHDNVINSGGVKLFPEQIEEKLQSIISERYIIASEPDNELGEKLILIIENPKRPKDEILSVIKGLKSLDRFEIPKSIYISNQFAETSSGKIQRQKTVDSVLG